MTNQELSPESEAILQPDGDHSPNGTSPRELPQSFVGTGEVRGFEFTQVARTDAAYLYRVQLPGEPTDRCHYEVFRREVNARFGTVSYPSCKAFGIWAWTASTLADAERRFHSLNRSHESNR